MSNKDFASLVTGFLTSEMGGVRGSSPRTQESYAETFSLLIEYYEQSGLPEDQITIDSFDLDNIEGFLGWLETERGNSASTRNQRLSCIRSFARYAIKKNPACYMECSKILNLPFKKTSEKPVAPMHRGDMKLMLSLPDTSNDRGIRDATVMALLYSSGCRVTEFTRIRIGDFDFRNATLHVRGKGRKERYIPINRPTVKLVKKYMARYGLSEDDGGALLFFNSRGEELTRQGVAHILDKYARRCRELSPGFYPENVTPHVFRHSIASHMIEDGASLIYVRDFLGHEHYETTERYAKTNPEVMRRAISEHSKAIEVDAGKGKVTKGELTKLLKKIKRGV